MPVAIKIADYVTDLHRGVHNFPTHTLRMAFSNTAPASETPNPVTTGNGVLANVTEVPYTNYADNLATDRTLSGVTGGEVGGRFTVDAPDVTITPAGGVFGPFQWVYLYNDTPASPADPLVICFELDAPTTIADGVPWILRWNALGIVYAQ